MFYWSNLGFGLMQVQGLKVTDVVVLIDREQGGEAKLASHNLRLHSAFTLSAILKVLVAHGLVSSSVEASVKAFISENQTFQGGAAPAAPKPAPKPHRHVSLACFPENIAACWEAKHTKSCPFRYQRVCDINAALAANSIRSWTGFEFWNMHYELCFLNFESWDFNLESWTLYSGKKLAV